MANNPPAARPACKRLLFVASVVCAPCLLGAQGAVPSGVFPWNGTTMEATDSGEVRRVLQGSALDLSHLAVEAVTLEPGRLFETGRTADSEEMIIVTSGFLDVTIGGRERTLGPGSVAVLFPGERHDVVNGGDEPATFFHFEYTSAAGMDPGRAAESGGSFCVDWNEVDYQPSDIGGRRHFFNRPTAMLSRSQLHVSTLNGGLTNHPVHTHRVEEMVLVIKGDVRMLVGDGHHTAGAGDLYFIQSEVPHSLDNIGDEPTEYFAFQWQ